jgi:hypothetical protein
MRADICAACGGAVGSQGAGEKVRAAAIRDLRINEHFRGGDDDEG